MRALRRNIVGRRRRKMEEGKWMSVRCRFACGTQNANSQFRGQVLPSIIRSCLISAYLRSQTHTIVVLALQSAIVRESEQFCVLRRRGQRCLLCLASMVVLLQSRRCSFDVLSSHRRSLAHCLWCHIDLFLLIFSRAITSSHH